MDVLEENAGAAREIPTDADNVADSTGGLTHRRSPPPDAPSPFRRVGRHLFFRFPRLRIRPRFVTSIK
jgi:hypothetical protein